MNIFEGVKQKGKPFWIPGASRDELPAFFKSLGFKVGVEVGVLRGMNVEKYCLEGFKMFGVDPYGRRRDHCLVSANKRLEKYKNYTLIRETSFEASKIFEKRSLDFVYIDGDHDFGFVALDLHLWMDKLKKGGVLAGHDYHSVPRNRGLRQIKAVVDAFADVSDIENFWILGTEEDHKESNFSYLMFKNW